MTKKTLLIPFLALAVGFTSCKKKSEDPETDPFKLEYSNLSVEENKKELEKSGIEFINEFNSLPDEKFIDVLDFFSTLNFNNIDLEINGVNNVLTIGQASSKKDLKRIFTSATAKTTKISDYYAVYTWSFEKEEFVKTASNNKIEFLFPSDESKSSNDATLTFTYQAGTTATIDGEKVELPKNSTAVLKVGAKEELRIVTSHEYKADGTPTKTDLVLTLGAFSINSGTVNDGTSASSTFSLKKGAKTLLSASISGEGKGAITAVENQEDDIVKNANATFEVMNFKLTGIANIQSIISESDAISDNSDAGRIQKEAAIWNKHAQLVAINATSNTLIAKVEFAGVVNQNCYDNWYWDYNTQQNIKQTYCYNDTEIEPRLVFKDGSKQTINAFTDSGFAGVINKMEDLMDRF